MPWEGMREREEANRTRAAGNLDEIQDGRDKISKCHGSHERDQRR